MLAPSSRMATESFVTGTVFQFVIVDPFASCTGTVETQLLATFVRHVIALPNTDRNSSEESVMTAMSPP